MKKMKKIKNNIDELTPQEKSQLRLWASATPAQRLHWLEEVQQLAAKSGALKEAKDP